MSPKLTEMHAKTIPQIADMVFRLSPSESANSTPTITFHKVRAQQPNAPVLGLGLSSGPWAEDSDQKMESDDPSKTPG